MMRSATRILAQGRPGTCSDDAAASMRNLLAILFCAIVVACSGPPEGPEAAVRAWVQSMEQAAEERDRSAILERISEHYADARGNGRKDIGDTLLVYFLRQQNVTILSTIEDIRISGDSVAEVTLTVAMAGSNTGSFGFDADAYRFELELERADGEWQLIGARWGQLGHELR